MRTSRSIRIAFCLASLVIVGACSKAKEADKSNAASATPETPQAAAAKPVEKAPEAPPPPATPCDGPEMAELGKQLQLANRRGLDLGDPKSQVVIDAAIASIKGKRVAFTNCTFKSQGNDEVSFAPRGDSAYEDQISCKMAGGEAGNKAFRDAAVSLDMARLKLDVVGTVGEVEGVAGATDYTLTECTIKPHE